MTYLKLSLLSVSLAALMLGCGTESDEPPLVPEIDSIEIEGPDSIHSIFIDGDEIQLTGTVIYSDPDYQPATVDSELDWESNDTTVITVNRLGIIKAVANGGTAAISASYRDKLYTEDNESKIIEIDALETVAISYNHHNLTQLDINTTGEHDLNANGLFKSNDAISAISSHIVWTSSNISVATVNSLSGTLNVLATGSTDINVSVYNEINTTLKLDVGL